MGRWKGGLDLTNRSYWDRIYLVSRAQREPIAPRSLIFSTKHSYPSGDVDGGRRWCVARFLNSPARDLMVLLLPSYREGQPLTFRALRPCRLLECNLQKAGGLQEPDLN